MKNIAIFLLLTSQFICAQTINKIECGVNYKDITFVAQKENVFRINLKKGTTYSIAALQINIDVIVQLKDSNGKVLFEIDSPNGANGWEIFEYKISKTQDYSIVIKNFEEDIDKTNARIALSVSKISKSEINRRYKIRKKLEPENNKMVQTIDIDHFWEAFDKLKNCKTHADSINVFQRVYFDRATDGFKDFIKVRNFTPEKYVLAVAKYPKYYASVRNNTFESKKATPYIEDIFAKFKKVYPDFKPFKVCFAIGLIGTAGTVSDHFVLIGAEMSTANASVDFSEFKNDNLKRIIGSDEPILQKIINLVAHECVHTQQASSKDPETYKCMLLYASVMEGICDFIGEMISGQTINKVAQEYGIENEAILWQQFQEEMCQKDFKKWLYNFSEVEDRPADLGYFMGYQIAKAYYEKASDKQKAVADIITQGNPIQFLELSGYSHRIKNQ